MKVRKGLVWCEEALCDCRVPRRIYMTLIRAASLESCSLVPANSRARRQGPSMHMLSLSGTQKPLQQLHQTNCCSSRQEACS